MEKMELSEALKANASVLEELIGFPYRGYKLATNENLDGFIERGVMQPHPSLPLWSV